MRSLDNPRVIFFFNLVNFKTLLIILSLVKTLTNKYKKLVLLNTCITLMGRGGFTIKAFTFIVLNFFFKKKFPIKNKLIKFNKINFSDSYWIRNCRRRISRFKKIEFKSFLRFQTGRYARIKNRRKYGFHSYSRKEFRVRFRKTAMYVNAKREWLDVPKSVWWRRKKKWHFYWRNFTMRKKLKKYKIVRLAKWFLLNKPVSWGLFTLLKSEITSFKNPNKGKWWYYGATVLKKKYKRKSYKNRINFLKFLFKYWFLKWFIKKFTILSIYNKNFVYSLFKTYYIFLYDFFFKFYHFPIYFNKIKGKSINKVTKKGLKKRKFKWNTTFNYRKSIFFKKPFYI